MEKLAVPDLLTLEAYAAKRGSFRQQVMAHKRNRRVVIGGHVSLTFEDRLTMQYQIQEILRTEKIFEPNEIRQELGAYNPLIPDGCNWKATMMLEYTDVGERRQALATLLDIQNRVYAMIEGMDPVAAIANEDLDRETEDKTSAVHFLRFELTEPCVLALKSGASLSFAIEHPRYTHSSGVLSHEQREALLADLD